MENRYKVKGIHCASCELIIEERLKQEKNIFSVDVDSSTSEILIKSKKKINKDRLNQIFKKNAYTFLELSKIKIKNKKENKNWWLPAIIIIALFLLLSKLGLASSLNINSKSSLWVFLLFGIIAGFSSCGALLSGIILSRPKETGKIILGRIISYSILGAILGLFGGKIRINGAVTNILLILVSIIMIIVALQMMEVKFAQKIKIRLPKKITKKIVSKKTSLLLGFLTVFLPCGFTLLTESTAVLSGSLLTGFLIMFFFALGSSIPLFIIGKSGDKLMDKNKTIGAIILFLVIYSLFFQFNLTNTGPATPATKTQNKIARQAKKEVEEFKDFRLVKATYSHFGGIMPNPIVVKKSENIRLEIDVKESEYGCMSTVLLPGLSNRAQTLTAGRILTMDFTPTKTGTYTFVCAMEVPHRGQVNVE